MHQFNSNLNKIENKDELLNKQIQEDLAHFNVLEEELKANKKLEYKYLNDRILRLQISMRHREEDIKKKQNEFTDIEKNKRNSIFLEKNEFLKQQEIDKNRLINIKKQIQIKKKQQDLQAVEMLRRIFEKEKYNLRNSIENNSRLIRLKTKELNDTIESNQAYINSMYEEILAFKNEELNAIQIKKAEIFQKYEEQEKIIKDTKYNIIKEAQKQLDKYQDENIKIEDII